MLLSVHGLTYCWLCLSDCAASVSQCIKLLHKERLPPQRVRTVAKILLGDATVKPRSLQRLACFGSYVCCAQVALLLPTRSLVHHNLVSLVLAGHYRLKGAMGEHEIKDCIK